MTKQYFTFSPSQTEALGKKLARELLKTSSKKGALVIGLEGDLGGGKTTFLRGFAKGLGIKQKILSPTFIIMRRFKNFYHFDCYRIKKPKEILALGFKQIVSNPKNIVCIEWVDRIKKILPKNSLILEFKFKGKNKREITLIPNQLKLDSRGREKVI